MSDTKVPLTWDIEGARIGGFSPSLEKDKPACNG